ncbi:hypothetical protein MTO96_026401 [Rhipicephalus appendiculatus]
MERLRRRRTTVRAAVTRIINEMTTLMQTEPTPTDRQHSRCHHLPTLAAKPAGSTAQHLAECKSSTSDQAANCVGALVSVDVTERLQKGFPGGGRRHSRAIQAATKSSSK